MTLINLGRRRRVNELHVNVFLPSRPNPLPKLLKEGDIAYHFAFL